MLTASVNVTQILEQSRRQIEAIEAGRDQRSFTHILYYIGLRAPLSMFANKKAFELVRSFGPGVRCDRLTWHSPALRSAAPNWSASACSPISVLELCCIFPRRRRSSILMMVDPWWMSKYGPV